MTLGERIKYVRRSKSMTQLTFSDKIGIKQQSLALIETGKRNTSEQVILSICREFHVNENWLRNDEGNEIFTNAIENSIDEIAEKYHLTDVGRFVIQKYVQLDEGMRSVFDAELKKIFEEWQTSEQKTELLEDSASKIAALEERNQKLEREIENLKKIEQAYKNLESRIAALEQEDELQNPWNDSDAG